MKIHDEYLDEFIPAMLPTRLGSSTDGDPQLAAAWLGWQERRKIDDARIRELEAALREAIDYVELDSETPYPMLANWKRALGSLVETTAERICTCDGIDQSPCPKHSPSDRGGK